MHFLDFIFTKYGKLTYADVSLLVMYLLLCLYVGFKNAGKIKNIKDYALGSGKISTIALVATLYATHIGAGATIGVIGRIAEIGILFAVAYLLQPMNWVMTLLLNRNIEQFEGCITPSDIVARLYDNVGRITMNVSILVAGVATIAAQIAALGSLLHFFLDIPPSTGIAIGASVLIFYSVMGGIRAVVVTDMVQFSLFYIIIPIACGLLLQKIGGLKVVIAAIPEDKWQFTWHTQDQMWIFWSAILYAFLPLNTAPFLQRFLMSMNKKQLTRSLLFSAALDVLLVVTLFLFALATIVLAKGEIISHQNTLWYILDAQLWSIIKGLFVIGLMAAIMSTADSYLNSAGVLIAKDIVGARYQMSDKVQVLIAKIATCGLGILGVGMVFISPRIMDLVWFSINFYHPITTIPIAVGFMGFRTNDKSFIASTVFAIIGVILGIVVQGKCDVLSNVFGISGSALGLFGAHYIQKALGMLDNVARQEKLYWQQYHQEEATKRGLSVTELQLILQQEKKAKHASQKSKSLFEILTGIFKQIKSFSFAKLLAYSQQSVEKFGDRYELFGFFGLSFCVYPILLIHTAPDLTGSHLYMWKADIYMRVILGFCCLTIALKHMWQEENVKLYMPLYFYAILMITLPALSTYSYLVLPEGTSTIAGMILSIFVVPLFVNWSTFAFITGFGFLLGASFYSFLGYLLTYQSASYDFVNGTIIYIVLSAVITFILFLEHEKNHNKLHRMANYDALTGLANRHYLNAYLNKLIDDAHARNNPLSVIAIDIDHFKKINDTYGHDVGDIVLQKLSELMIESSRPLDICARLGGEEFLMLLPCTSINEAQSVAQRLHQKISESVTVITHKNSEEIKYTVSMGVTKLQLNDNQETFLKRADELLYNAKKLGRNTIQTA